MVRMVQARALMVGRGELKTPVQGWLLCHILVATGFFNPF